eukprot:TRINITY_DN33331_c0_g1_i1.p1 TRINITY_DN33331_c0_g1~~TRINITY_DN33331_c0_g1_i1.p1  ORF type:complete len:563 (+),score=77.87 TRINITY_DN33331_c0_g1_i1:52-1740(+)
MTLGKVAFALAIAAIDTTEACGFGDASGLGSLLKNNDLREVSEQGAGAVASRLLGDNDILATVPNSFVFTAIAACPTEIESWQKKLQSSPLGGSNRFDESALDVDVLALCLLRTCEQSDSDYAKMLRALPMLTQMEEIPLVQLVESKQNELWEHMTIGPDIEIARWRRLRSVWSTVAAGNSDNVDKMTTWALAIAQSYAVSLRQTTHTSQWQLAVVPIIGTLQRETAANLELLLTAKGDVEISALRTVTPGNTLSLPVHEMSQRQYLMLYGKAETNLPHKLHYLLPEPSGSKTKATLAQLQQVLKVDTAELANRGADIVCRGKDADVTAALAYFRFAVLDDEEIDKAGGLSALGCSSGVIEAKRWLQAGSMSAPPPGPSCPKIVSEDNELKAVESLKNFLQRRSERPSFDVSFKGKKPQEKIQAEIMLMEWECTGLAFTKMNQKFLWMALDRYKMYIPVLLAVFAIMWFYVFPYINNRGKKKTAPDSSKEAADSKGTPDVPLAEAQKQRKDAQAAQADHQVRRFLTVAMEKGYVTKRLVADMQADEALAEFFPQAGAGTKEA